jgi:CPA1 family monovalent cation:H+ antiporter
VVLGTLIIQGMTLRPLLSWLNLRDNDPVGHEVGRARRIAYAAAIAAHDGDVSPAANTLRSQFQDLLTEDDETATQGPARAFNTSLLRAIDAARKALLDLRANDEIGDDAFHRLEEELDRIELSAA